MWKNIGVICSTILGVLALMTILYKLDCYNIVVHGDTVFAKDVEFKALKQMQKLERKIRDKSERLDQLKAKRKDNLLWLSRVKDQYPDSALMPAALRKEVNDTEKEQEKLDGKITDIEERLEKWTTELDELELEMEPCDPADLDKPKGGER